ncbi:MAG: hypothetical protein ACLUFV_13090 [Acutalibacteraceae bacterium]
MTNSTPSSRTDGKSGREKAQKLGIDAYNREQTEKLGMLTKLLAEYNDGRKKALSARR